MAATKVIVEGPVSFPTRGVERDVRPLARSLSRPFVIDTTVGRRRCFDSSPTSLTISALSPDWLTMMSRVSRKRIGRRKCSSSAVSTRSEGTPRPARSFTAG